MPSITLSFKVRDFRFSALLIALCMLPITSQAQVFRIVGLDGKVTFSDKPPADVKARPATGNVVSVPVGNGAALPYELQQVALKYPVTFYTTNDCSPCASARAMLISRGIPFAEKTVGSNDDVLALQRVSGQTSLPFLTIGSQQLKGFSDAEWTQYFNAAGYPPSSVLPATYRAPAPAPLGVAKVLVPTSAVSEVKAPAVPVTPVQPNANPSGIQF